ncbi:hypothetical protein H9Q70_003686 [Fusarium xylarioides]|nr:hypothetical protein H9Q70_003686 [Fusarium xylarioides]KAG5782888.1 hypothetical protein H9Q73_003481 [Fusarium xylarioides]KAG5803859.1 hypothetical protein H9Q71_011553 [Fusarium xylarioides]
MADHSDAGPTRSPYASGICAVYFSEKGPLHIPRSFLTESMKEATKFNLDAESHTLEMWLDDITVDAGHVIIHYLVTGTYQCLQPQEKEHNKKISAELASAIRVYIATGILGLPRLREMARAEIVNLGDQLSLPVLITVMEEAALPFDENPAIATYIESRVLSFNQNAIPDGESGADIILDMMGISNSLSKVLLRSIILTKASESRQQEDPNYQPTTSGYPAIVLRSAEAAMKQAEEQTAQIVEKEAARQAEEVALADEALELRHLRQKRSKGKKLTRKQQSRLDILDRKNTDRRRREQEARKVEISGQQPAEEHLASPSWAQTGWVDRKGRDPCVATPYPYPTDTGTMDQIPEPKTFERPNRCDFETGSDRSLTIQFTPVSSQSSSVDEVALDW